MAWELNIDSSRTLVCWLADFHWHCTVGNITILYGEIDSDQLVLTCISSGGPATTVTWTRDSTTVTQGTQTVLNDPVTANYTHTLTVTTAGEYTCTVSNDKPSSASSTIFVAGTMHFLRYSSSVLV